MSENAEAESPGPDRSVAVFLAGASGVIGRHLVPLLVAAGHTVTGLTRSPEKVDRLGALGCRAVVGDVFDADALAQLVAAANPGVVIDQLTDLPGERAQLPAWGARNARVRREGTRNLLAAARSAGATRYLAQSVAWDLPGDGGAAVIEREQMVLDFGGVVLRYGQFYGPGTYYPDAPPDPPRIQVATAAQLTVAALGAAPGIVIIAE